MKPPTNNMQVDEKKQNRNTNLQRPAGYAETLHIQNINSVLSNVNSSVQSLFMNFEINIFDIHIFYWTV